MLKPDYQAPAYRVNTNDVFTGLNNVELEDLEHGQRIVYYSHPYDVGTNDAITNFNSELGGAIARAVDDNFNSSTQYC